MIQLPNRIQGRKGVRNIIKAVCEAHEAIAQFKTGLNLLEDASESDYPLAFLEYDYSGSTSGDVESYPIALCVADYISADASTDEIFNAMCKTDETVSEIHTYLQQIRNIKLKVGDVKKQTFQDYDDDKVVVTRAEFTIDIPRYTAKDNKVIGELKFIDSKPVTLVYPDGSKVELKAGSVFYMPTNSPDDEVVTPVDEFTNSVNLTANTPYTLTHNLNSDVLVKFMLDGAAVISNYDIIDQNTVLITASVDVFNLQVTVVAADYAASVNMVANTPQTIIHNLSSTNLTVQFYLNNEAVLADYTIIDLNTITVESDIDVTALKVVIAK